MTAPGAAWAAIVWTLTDLGFPRENAEAWAGGWSCRPAADFVAFQATLFDDHGLPVDLAVEWHQHGFYADEALPLADAGWRPDQAAVLVAVAPDDVDEWLAIDLEPDQVLAYLYAGIGLGEVAAFEDADHGVAATQMLAALLG